MIRFSSNKRAVFDGAKSELAARRQLEKGHCCAMWGFFSGGGGGGGGGGGSSASSSDGEAASAVSRVSVSRPTGGKVRGGGQAAPGGSNKPFPVAETDFWRNLGRRSSGSA